MCFSFLMFRRPPRSTLFPTRRSSDLGQVLGMSAATATAVRPPEAPPRLGGDRPGRLLTIAAVAIPTALAVALRSEEHTSELQSRQYLVCRLLLEKKKKKKHHNTHA